MNATKSAPAVKEAPREIVKARHIAERYDVDVRTVLRWKDSGKIPHIKVGKTIRFDRAAVIAALEGNGGAQ